MVDAGWSYPGWWARECTVVGVDCETGLPVAIYHVIRDKNYVGSSRGINDFKLQIISNRNGRFCHLGNDEGT